MINGVQVTYKLKDPSIDTDTQTKTQSGNTAHSNIDNCYNLLSEKKKGAYLEKRYFKLDGTHKFLTTGDDVGWESYNLSNDTGAVNGTFCTLNGTADGFTVPLDYIEGATTQATGTPTPTAPIPLVSVEQFNINYYGKSLIDETKLVNNANINTTTGLQEVGSRTVITDFISVLPNTLYALTRPVNTGNMGARYYDINKTYLGATPSIIGAGLTKTFTTPANCYYFKFVDEANTLTAGYQFGKYATISINQPLRSFGDLKDKYYSDGSLKRFIGKAVFNGVENWVIDGGLVNNKLCFFTFDLTVTANAVSDKFPFNYIKDETRQNEEATRSGSGYFEIIIDVSRLSTPDVAGFTTWLGTNNVTVNYPLATPTTETVTPITIPTYDGQTNIFTTAITGNVPTMYVLDINEWVNFAFADTHDSYGIIIEFPQNDVAKNFDIIYSANGTVLHTTSVTNNTEYNYRDLTDVNGWDNIKIHITALNNKGQRARINKIVFGITEEFDEDSLIRVTASRATDLTAGNSESGEVEFQFYNKGTFDIETIKDLPEEIQQNIGIEVRFGRNGVYSQFGKYFSTGMRVDDGGKLITVSGYDEFHKLGTTFYKVGTVPTTPKSLGAWASEVAEDGGIELTVDSSLSAIYSSGYIPYVPHREALRLIAEAGNCIIYTDVNGVNYIAPQAGGTAIAITDDYIVKDTLNVTNTEKVNGVIVEKFTYTKSATAVGLAEVQDIALTGSSQEIWIDYATYPAEVSTISSSSNLTITGNLCYTDRCKIIFTGTAGQVGWITIIGYPYAVAKTNVTAGSGGNVKIISNPLITSTAMANSVLANQSAKLLSKYKYSADIVVNEEVGLGQEAILSGDNIYITKISREINTERAIETVEGYDK